MATYIFSLNHMKVLWGNSGEHHGCTKTDIYTHSHSRDHFGSPTKLWSLSLDPGKKLKFPKNDQREHGNSTMKEPSGALN